MKVASYEVYTVNNQLKFYITETKIIVCTPLQTSLIIFMNGNYKRRWEKLKIKIRQGEIKSISDLISYNKPRIAGVSQIQGLVLVHTRLERYVSI
jgi:hypothetical protein